ncbi:MAG TPA: PRC-barrel domain-containing protein [Gammaproteobacteria bacterium]
MRRECGYVALTAAAAMLCGTAAGQDEQTQQREARDDRTGAWADSLTYDEFLAGRDLRASDLLDARVQNQQGEELGRVEDLVVSRDDDVTQAVIAVGGVLGVGEKRIAVPYEELRVSRDGETLLLARTREQLEALPEYRAEERGAGLAEGAASQRSAAAEQLAVQQQEAAEQGGEPSSAEQAAAQQQAQQAEQQAQQAERQAERQADQAEQQEQQAQQAQQEQQEQEAQQRPQASERVTVMDRSHRRASELIGMTVVDSRGEEIGEIDDLVVSPADGRVFAVLAVGGVVGIGERLISVPLEDLELSTPALEPREPGVAGEPDEDAARLKMTSEQLIETQPEFQYSTDERTADLG